MDSDDPSGPGAPEPRRRTDQEIFDEQVARASGKLVVMFGGLGIAAALIISTVALIVAANKSNTTTVAVPSASAGARTTSTAKPAGLTGDALGAQLFISGKPSVGAIGCASCHTMKAAGATGKVGPNLDKELSADPATATRESIVSPNKEIVPGYSANVMPTNYGTAFTKSELDALVTYVYHSTNLKAKAALAKKAGKH